MMVPYSVAQLALLEKKAREYTTNHTGCQIYSLYRNKDESYFSQIQEDDGIMYPYTKDEGGDPRCPINGRLDGLFFLGKVNNPKSPFGNSRISIPANRLLNDDHRLYFADFFCMTGKHHYVTTVVTVAMSKADAFCEKHLLELNKYNNPYLWLSTDGRVYMAQGTMDFPVWIEVFYTERIKILNNAGKFKYWMDDCDIIGQGQSMPSGIPKAQYCRICNL